MSVKKASSEQNAKIVQVDAVAFITGPTKNVVALRNVLDAVASESALAPTHGSMDDQTREAFEAAKLAGTAGETGGKVWLWRQKRCRYWGAVDATPLPLGRVFLHLEDIGSADVPSTCESLLSLMDALRPAYAAVHFRWDPSTDDHSASATGLGAKAIEYCKFGLPGVFAWTWFGPALVEDLGKPLLRDLGGKARPWGGMRLDLAEAPWEVPFEQLRAKQIEVDDALRTTGLFGKYSIPKKKAPKWKRLSSKGGT